MPPEHGRPGRRSSIVRDKEWKDAATLQMSTKQRSRSRSSRTWTVADSESGGEDARSANANIGHCGTQSMAETCKKVAEREKRQRVILKARLEKEGKDVILKERDSELLKKREEVNKKYKAVQLKGWYSNTGNTETTETWEDAADKHTLETPYMRAWSRASDDLKSILLEMELTMAPTDGDTLAQMMRGEDRKIFVDQFKEMIPYAKRKEEPQVTEARWMQELLVLTRAAARTDITKLTPTQWEENKYIKQKAKRLDPYKKEMAVAVNKWRHYNPKNAKVAPAATQLKLEKELRKKWAVTLIRRFIPHREMIPHMKKVQDTTDPMQEYVHLLGRARWRTLKSWNSQLKQIMKLDETFIPWNETTVRQWMSKIAAMETEEAHTPAKFQNQWNVINKLGSLLGMLRPEEVPPLVAKKEAIMEELVQTITKKDMRAIPPNVEMVELMERQAESNGSMVKRYYAAIWRFMVATSARFNDIQHTAPSSVKELPGTVEAEAWQTKTTRMASKKQRPVVLVAPKIALRESTAWWKPVVETCKIFKENSDFMHMDFMVPAVTRDRTGFIPRPATNNQFLKVTREIMYENTNMEALWTVTERGGAKKEIKAWEAIKKTTNAAPRVWMPEWANKANIPRVERACLGRWADEPMADVYTREQRCKIVELWKKAKAQKGLMSSMEPVPTDLEHEHYTGDCIETKAEVNTPTKTPMKDGSPAGSKRQEETPQKWRMDEGTEWAELEMEEFKTLRQITDKVMEIGRMPADLLPPRLGGPLAYMARPKTKDTKPLKVHLITTEMKGIGCGTKADKYICPTNVEIDNLAACVPGTGMEICLRCFKYFTWTRGQATAGKEQIEQEESDVDSDSDSSNSDTSNDTVSEQEALKIEEIDEANADVDEEDI